MEPLKGYIDIMSNANCDWRAVLSLSTNYATVEDLLAVGSMRNLVALEITKTPWQPHKYSPDITPRAANELEDGVIRTWVDLAESTGSLQHLRVIRLYQQALTKPAVLQLLQRLPNLQLIVIYQCERFTQSLSHTKRPSRGKAADMEGWDALRLDWAFADEITEESRVLQPLGPLLDVYRQTLNTQPDPSSLDDIPLLGADVPIMEFGLPAMDHGDIEKVGVRAHYAAKSIATLTRVSSSGRKRQPSLPAKPKSDKRIMKNKDARDIADVLNDFF